MWQWNSQPHLILNDGNHRDVGQRPSRKTTDQRWSICLDGQVGVSMAMGGTPSHHQFRTMGCSDSMGDGQLGNQFASELPGLVVTFTACQLELITIWLVVWTPLKNISQLGWLFPIYGKIKNVPNHQPAISVKRLNQRTFYGHFQWQTVSLPGRVNKKKTAKNHWDHQPLPPVAWKETNTFDRRRKTPDSAPQLKISWVNLWKSLANLSKL